jgi:hypothetical protein
MVLAIRAATAVLTIGLVLVLLDPFGGTGAAWAVLIGNVGTRIAMGMALARFNRSGSRAAASAQAANVLEADEA